MLRNLVCAGIVLSASLGLAFAEPVKGKLESVKGNKITITTMAKKGEKGESKTYDAAANVKVQKTVGKNTEALADGLKASELSKGAAVVLEVTGNTVSEITVAVKKAKK